MDGVRAAAASSYSSSYPATKSHKESVLDGVRVAAASAQPGSSHTIVLPPGESPEARRRAQQEEFRRREEEILEKKRKAKGQPVPLISHGSMPSVPTQSGTQEAPPALTSHPTMPSIPTQGSITGRNPLPEPPSVRLVAPSQSQSQVSMPVPSNSMYQQPPSSPYNTTQPSQYTSPPAQYSNTSSLQPQFTGSSQYTGTSGLLPQFTGTSTSSAASSQPSSRQPAQIPPQFQLPPMPAPAVYTPFQSRLNGPRPSESGANVRPITDSGALTPQRQAPRPPTAYTGQSQNAAPTRGADPAYSRAPETQQQLSEQFGQMGMTNSHSQSSSTQSTPQPQLMPLESPTRYGYEGDSTDSESVSREGIRRDNRRDHRRGDGRGDDSSR